MKKIVECRPNDGQLGGRPFNRGLPNTDDRSPGEKLYAQHRDQHGPWGAVWLNLSIETQYRWEDRAAQIQTFGEAFEPLDRTWFAKVAPPEVRVSFWTRFLRWLR